MLEVDYEVNIIIKGKKEMLEDDYEYYLGHADELDSILFEAALEKFEQGTDWGVEVDWA